MLMPVLCSSYIPIQPTPTQSNPIQQNAAQFNHVLVLYPPQLLLLHLSISLPLYQCLGSPCRCLCLCLCIVAQCGLCMCLLCIRLCSWICICPYICRSANASAALAVASASVSASLLNVKGHVKPGWLNACVSIRNGTEHHLC